MTELLYQTNSYLKEFDATVLELNEKETAVALDRTAFYPGGGGQPHDVGWLEIKTRTWPVTQVKKEGPLVWHWLDGPLVPPGTHVSGHLDWDIRYKLMRTHTALHILCGVIWRDYNAQVTGANMEPLYARMDFEFESLNHNLIREIEEKVNLEVENNREVTVRILPRREAFQIPDLIRTKINLLPEGINQIRVVEIVGLDIQADGGTHVGTTSEVGHIRIVDYKSKGRINKRIYVELKEK